MKENCSALILAAGYSSRLGKPKFLLKVSNERTFLENIAWQYKDFGCSEIVIVLNNEGAEIVATNNIKLPDKAKIVINKNADLGRTTSILTGLQETSTDFVFIHNVDGPFANTEVLNQLYDFRKGYDVIKPVWNGKSGHPVLISGKVRKSIISKNNIGENLRKILAGFTSRKVEVKDDSILMNINTIEDYKRLIKDKIQS